MESDSKKFKTCKNPDVDTSFLPDREREEEENKLREELRQVVFSVFIWIKNIASHLIEENMWKKFATQNRTLYLRGLVYQIYTLDKSVKPNWSCNTLFQLFYCDLQHLWKIYSNVNWTNWLIFW